MIIEKNEIKEKKSCVSDISSRFSRKVIRVSFILAVCVMYIHADKLVKYFVDLQSGIPYVLYKVLAGTFGTVGVPFFFLQSGYWMFRFSIFEEKSDRLKSKLKKKVYSIGIPFLLWNSLGLLFFLIVTRIPGIACMINDGQVVPITIKNIFEGIFLHKFYIVFWFMQDLIVMTIFSPVLIRLLRNRYLIYVTIIVLLVLSVLGINSPVCQTTSLLFFTIGGILSVYHRDFWETFNGNHYETIIYLALFLVCAVIRWFSLPVLSTISLVVSPILFWKSCDWLTLINVFDHEPMWFCKQSFFIYAAHDFLVESMSAVLSKVSNHMAWVSICYIVTPLIVLIFLYIVARLLSQRLPKVYQLLCGGRN